MTISGYRETAIPTTVPSEPVNAAGNPDAAFIEASEKCINETPVIVNLTTRNTFTNCFQKTPTPVSQCGYAYRENVLKYTDDDPTTAGCNRMNHNIQLFRTWYFRGGWWDIRMYGWFPCTGHEGEFEPVLFHHDI